MSARLSTHVLDTSRGRPAADVTITVHRISSDGTSELLAEAVTNGDGRTDAPLLEGDLFGPGVYELTFAVGEYFASAGPIASDAVAFLDLVPVRFATPGGEQLHVPLLVTPWSYSTYRGS